MIAPDAFSEIDRELWAEWIDYRKTDLNKPASDRSLRMTLKKLEKLSADGYDPNALIELAIEREWRGIFKHDDCKRDTGDTDRKRSAAERVRENARRGDNVRALGLVNG